MISEVKQQLLQELEVEAGRAASAEHLMETICRRLAADFPHYNWVGFYMLDPEDANLLVLGPFVGAPTPHTRIPLHQGICGAAASSGQTQIVEDVSTDPRYLACSIETRSEVVAPVLVYGRVAGELDIDSHAPAAFTPEDVTFIERCAALVGGYLERTGRP